LFVAACLAVTSTALAQTPIAPFTGQYQEGFENGPQVLFLPCIPNGVFGGQAQMCTPNNSGCHTTGSWGYQCQIYPHSGGWIFGSAGGAVEFTFTTPVSRFGGYFGINSGYADATFEFYGAAARCSAPRRRASRPTALGTGTAGRRRRAP
jgi:hypothetical protein